MARANESYSIESAIAIAEGHVAERRSRKEQSGAKKMRTRPLPEATQKRIILAVQVLLLVAGAAMASVAIAGLLDLVIMDSQLKFGLLVLGVAMILTGVFRVNLIQFVI